jgi:hypothetical protein
MSHVQRHGVGPPNVTTEVAFGGEVRSKVGQRRRQENPYNMNSPFDLRLTVGHKGHFAPLVAARQRLTNGDARVKPVPV